MLPIFLIVFLSCVALEGLSFSSRRESDFIDPLNADDKQVKSLNSEIDRLRDHLYVVGEDRAPTQIDKRSDVLLRCRQWAGLAQGLMAKDLRLKVHGGVLKEESFEAFDTSVNIAREFVMKIKGDKGNKGRNENEQNEIQTALELVELSLQTLFR